jgi:exodeoxyribonuclease VII small subunit
MEKFNYTKAIKRLEEIIEQIDNGQLEIDQLSEKLKEATLLLAKCQKKLTQTNGEVEKTMQSKQHSEE